MKIVLKVESDEKIEQIIFTNEDIDNYNFIELIIDGKKPISLLVNINELYQTLKIFKKLNK